MTHIEYGIWGHTKKIYVREHDPKVIQREMFRFLREMRAKGWSLRDIVFVWGEVKFSNITTLRSVHSEQFPDKKG